MASQPRHPGAPRQLSWSGLGWVVLAAPVLLIAALAAALVALPLALAAWVAPRRLRHARAAARIDQAMSVGRGASFDQMVGGGTAHLRRR
ncbi:MAG: hypothetical protein ABI574_01620 [Burkholderiales bacterium]